MMRQYFDAKKKYPDTVLLFRMGDFYEMFYDDAEEVAKLLNLTLTRRDKKNNIPMCGIPYHAAEGYIGKLLKLQKRVAICEQTEDPKKAKGLVKRDVVRVITPSTTFDDAQLDDRSNNFLVSIALPRRDGTPIGFARLDITTGQFDVAELPDEKILLQELVAHPPREIVVPDSFPVDEWAEREPAFSDALVVPLETVYFDDGRNVLLNHYDVHSLDGFGCGELSIGITAAGAAMRYVLESLPEASLDHIRPPHILRHEKFMIIDDVSRRNLELLKALRDGSTKGTLLGVLDTTVTVMGGRLIRQWITAPLISRHEIIARQDAIELFIHAQDILPTLRETLSNVMDIERVSSRLSTGYGSPRDVAALRESLLCVPHVKEIISKVLSQDIADSLTPDADEPRRALLSDILAHLDELPELRDELCAALVDDPPLKIQDGGIIREGYDEELDESRALAKNGKDWIAKLQITEAEKTGIKSLKVGYNKVFGYYIEVTKPNLHLVPETYIRKQTISTGERFVTPELKEMEARILNADENAHSREYDLFQQLRLKIAAENTRLHSLAHALASIDVLQTLAWHALRRNYSRPVITEDTTLHIEGGRHPVVEQLLPNQEFVPNDSLANTDDAQIIVLTGPNMSGKSTYIRQVAIITLMAHMGSYVPADAAHIGIVDRIFTRVGASDELTRGQSTFMVEMAETANILNNATPRSLIILDEIGRGTSTYDGLSIAWAVIEYLHNSPHVKAKTFFATHYHELVQLEHQLHGVVNYNVDVREYKGDVVFLHKIVRGGSDRSYGIHVARLAGVPAPVIERAQNVLEELESAHQPHAKHTIDETVKTKSEEEQPHHTTEDVSEKIEKAEEIIPESPIEKTEEQVEETEEKPEEQLDVTEEEPGEEEPGEDEAQQLTFF